MGLEATTICHESCALPFLHRQWGESNFSSLGRISESYCHTMHMHKNFYLCHNFWTSGDGDSIFHMCIPCNKDFHQVQYTINFDLVTLTSLKFNILLKIFSLGHNLLTWRNRASMFHVCALLVTRPFMSYHIFGIATLTLKFDYFSKTFNHSHNFLTERVRAFICQVHSCDKTFETDS